MDERIEDEDAEDRAATGAAAGSRARAPRTSVRLLTTRSPATHGALTSVADPRRRSSGSNTCSASAIGDRGATTLLRRRRVGSCASWRTITSWPSASRHDDVAFVAERLDHATPSRRRRPSSARRRCSGRTPITTLVEPGGLDGLRELRRAAGPARRGARRPGSPSTRATRPVDGVHRRAADERATKRLAGLA